LRVANGALGEAAPIEHLVAKRLGFLGRVSPVVRRKFLEDSFDIVTEGGDLFGGEHLVEKDNAICLKELHRSRNWVGTKSQVSASTSQHALILPATTIGPPLRRSHLVSMGISAGQSVAGRKRPNR
jgi:hypothetical protein